MTVKEKILCVVCPGGCEITVSIDDNGKIAKVEGNECKEGRKYAIQEYKNPARILTGTVLTQSSLQPLLPVRTNKPIDKTRLIESMHILAKVRAKPSVKAGDILVPNLLNTGADLVATADLSS
jgi:CxxC motif-containing protein